MTMLDIKRILVPINDTKEAFSALSMADNLAQIYNAQIALLLVTYFNEKTDSSLDGASWLSTPLPVQFPAIPIVYLTVRVCSFPPIYR